MMDRFLIELTQIDPFGLHSIETTSDSIALAIAAGWHAPDNARAFSFKQFSGKILPLPPLRAPQKVGPMKVSTAEKPGNTSAKPVRQHASGRRRIDCAKWVGSD
jgi:hypothetical protein